jgi:hypothetical protein
VSGFVEVGSYWVRSADIVRIQPVRSYDRGGHQWAYGVQVDFRFGDRYVTYTAALASGDDPAAKEAAKEAAEEAAEEERDTYIRDLLERMRLAEREG